MSRDKIDLCNSWRLQLDPQNEGEQLGYWRADYDDRRWREISVPCSLEQGHPDLEWYVGAGWYRRSIHIPESWQGRRIALRFEGANYHTTVWVNGGAEYCAWAGQNQDGFLPFEIPMHDLLLYGRENSLVVRVDNDALAGEVPGKNVGWRPFGGILREVSLQAMARCYVAEARVVAAPAAAALAEEGGGELALEATVRNEDAVERTVSLAVRVLDARGQAIGQLDSQERTLSPGQESSLQVRGELAGIVPWSPDRPALYTAQISLRLRPVQGALWPETEALDTLSTRCGFRRIETQGATLLLNGRPIHLRGFNRHEDSPTRGACTDLATVRRDLLDMKALGANFVRLCHYPHHPGELDLCDELGLLAMGEVPVYGSTGMAEDDALFRSKMEAAQRQLTTMIRRDGNHPSIIFWSVSNETHEQHPVVVEGNNALIRHVRSLDPTRLVVHVSDHWQPRRDGSGGSTAFDLDDVICLNAYPWMGDPGLARAERLGEQTRWWAENLAQLHALFPDKPILITEFGYVSYEGAYGYLLGEDTHAANLEANYAGMSAPYVCGATIWCYAEHAWPHGVLSPFIGAPAQNPIAPYGVVTRQRVAKATVCAAVQHLFAAKRAQDG